MPKQRSCVRFLGTARKLSNPRKQWNGIMHWELIDAPGGPVALVKRTRIGQKDRARSEERGRLDTSQSQNGPRGWSEVYDKWT